MKTINIFESFAGIGSQRKALNNAKIEHKVVGLAEWYISAIVGYQTIHNGLNNTNIDKDTSIEEMISYLSSKPLSANSKNVVPQNYWNKYRNKEIELRKIYTAVKWSEEKDGNIFDVTTLYKRGLSDVDLLTYSFPCQDLSQQGKQRGMTKGSGTRSGLLWEIEKSLEHTPKENLPKYLLMENVQSLMFAPNKEDLQEWLDKLESLGYHNDLKVLNSADFGSSQARRRAFMISTLHDKKYLPEGTKQPAPIKKILSDNVEEHYFLPKLDKLERTEFHLTKSNINKTNLIGYTTWASENMVYDPLHTGPTLTSTGSNSRIKILIDGKIRRLTPVENYLYMGFSKKDFENVEAFGLHSESKHAFLCGNSIVVDVLECIFKKVL